ncbi:hypothetical protein SLEP1_g14726 [Rubroshorea leprosula]|uniref:AAA+ ATPase domain-containing protein n=1 Tax=Rubroshorea leprosula TaxID=152421 RepID=A0AAV5IQX7_9ROSI|nr:hypothetical protein SLEP1_g14726 [Rubroshorea leprosula]
MAESILGPVIEEALFKVASFTAGQIRLAWGLEKELSKLRSSLNLIQHVLQDAEERQSEVAIRDWLQELKDVAYDMVDVLDEVEYEVLQQKVETQSQVKRVRNFFSPSNPIAFRFNIANKIKKINESLVKVREDAVFTTLLARNKSPRVGKSQPGTHSFLDSKFESRRDEDVTEIVKLLTEQRSHQHPISVISLIGMAGVGKTTLAKLLCKEIKNRNLFDEVAWVCVSDDFDERAILKGMLEYHDQNAGGINNIDVLLKRLEEKLEKKTFLLVLDDVWEDNSNTWATFSGLLSNFVKTSGNSIVVTTRKEGVASSIAECLPLQRHPLKRLSDDDCWLIIKEKAFGSTEASIPDQQLEDIVFPKDFNFEKDDLIQHWMAQGFLCSSSQEMMEDIGNKYVSDLISNCLFHDVETDKYGDIISFKMHDVVHDLALLVSEGETLILKNDSIHENSCIRHLKVPSSVVVDPTILRGVAPKLHSLFSEVDFCSMSRMDLKSIRSLSLKKADGDKLPASPSKLKHLRYLDISNTKIRALPKSFSKLYNLQTLKLMYCSHLQKLPDGMENLISLRHFYFSNDKLMPRNIGRLTSLQTLSLFVVGKEKGYHIEELGRLSQLGALRICNLEFVKSKSEATKANMEQKTRLYEVKLEWGRSEEEGYNSYEEVLEGLQPPSNLKKLSISGYMGEKFPSWMEKGVNLSGDAFLLNNLLKLGLYGCGECMDIPSLGFLPNLQNLKIWSMEKVKRMGSKFYLNRSNIASSSHGGGDTITLFSALKTLRIDNMGSLEEWAEIEGVLVFPCLEKLEIRSCPKLRTWSMSGFASHHKLSELLIYNCSSLVAIPNIDGQLSLKTLSIYDCPELVCLPNGLDTCTSLQDLWINRCSNLEEFSGLSISHPNISIEVLSLNRCDKIKSLPHQLQHLVALKRLSTHNCNGVEAFPEWLTRLKQLKMGPFYSELEEFPGLTSIHHLRSSLENLELVGWDNLKSLPDQLQHLTALKELKIDSFTRVEALPEWLGNLSSLTSLSIHSWNKLKSIPEECLGRLTCLKRLSMGPFWSELEEYPGLTSTHHLHSSLKSLTLEGWDKLKSLPHQLRHLTALQQFTISRFNGVEALPECLGDLSSLQWLNIYDCDNLTHLPSVKVMHRLSNLETFYIGNCPKLKERCARERGPEWPKISLIPSTHIW